MDSIAVTRTLREQVAMALGGTQAAYAQAETVLGVIDQYQKAPKPTPEQRFWSKVNKTDTCWLWTGMTDPNGYGLIKYGGRNRLAHRVSYELSGREAIGARQIDHLCRVRLCVNPDHLEPVTSKLNTLRGLSPSALNATKTHCVRGHEFNDENTRTYRGKRYCRACSRIRQQERGLNTHPHMPCSNCGELIRTDAKSTTGFLHVSTSALRCDGRDPRARSLRPDIIAVP